MSAKYRLLSLLVAMATLSATADSTAGQQAYYVQAHGAKLVYGPPTVFQDRNVHDLTRDLAAEFVGYEHTLTLLERLERDPMAIFEFMPERAGAAYRAYRKHFE